MGLITVYLNRMCGNLLDWNRVGQLLISAKHRYSGEEVRIRGMMVAAVCLGTVIGGFTLIKLFGSNKYMAYAGSALISFIITHAVALERIVAKRIQMKSEIAQLQGELYIFKCDYLRDELAEIVEKLTNKITEIESKNNASSETLGMRKRLLTTLLSSLRKDIQLNTDQSTMVEKYNNFIWRET